MTDASVRSMPLSNNITELHADADFATELSSHAAAHHIVEFYAPWCEPCKAVKRPLHVALRRLQKRRRDVRALRANGELVPLLIRRFAIADVPTLLLFQAGQTSSEIARSAVHPFITQGRGDIRASVPLLESWIDNAVAEAARADAETSDDGDDDDVDDEDRDPFRRCLLTEDERSWSHSFLPTLDSARWVPELRRVASPLMLYAMCRNQTCVEEVHAKRYGGRYLPQQVGSSGARAAIKTPIFSSRRVQQLGAMPGQRSVAVETFDCRTKHIHMANAHRGEILSDQPGIAMAAVDRLREALRTSVPVVLQGCALSMPAVLDFRNDSLLKSLPGGEGTFSPLWQTKKSDAVERLDPSEAWARHYKWWAPSPGHARTQACLHVPTAALRSSRLFRCLCARCVLPGGRR